jgi:predicted phosphodiesterase
MIENKLSQGFVIILAILFCVNTINAIPFSDETRNIIDSNNRIYLLENTEESNQLNSPFKILYPRFSCPVITEPGESLVIEIDRNNFDKVSINIETAHEPVTDSYWLPVNDINTNGITKIAVTIPEYCPVELYNLTIFIEDSRQNYSQSQPHSISIIDNITESYSFIHIADLHLGDIRGITENIRETIGWKSIKRCIEEVNILSPDFVVITGDLVFGQLLPFEYSREYKQLYSILQLFDVPIYLVPGNHDGYNRILEDGLEFWSNYFGSYYYSFNFGSSHFQVINSYDHSKIERLTFLFIPLNWGGSISNQQLEWIEQDLELFNNSDISFMFMHHNPLWDTTRESLIRKAYENRVSLLELIDEYNIDMVLAGHVHYDNITMQNNTVFLTTTTPESSISKPDGYWGYRHIFVENGSIASYNYKEPKYSNPTYKLDIEDIDSYNKKAINELEIPISAMLKFIMPIGNYTIQNGVILYQRQNEILLELYVKTMVQAQDSNIVTLQPI